MVNGQNQPTQKELAAALDMSQANVTKLKKQGMPVDSVAAAQAWRESRQNVAARKPAPPGLTLTQAIDSMPIYPPKSFDAARMPEYRELPDEDHQAARTRREIAEANLAEMREAEERGKLIQVSAVRATWATRIASARDALLQIPARIAPVLAAETNLAAVTLLMESELRQALAELSREDAGT
jgi:phage terminase Nu1 subunit (DNA packaging protein)